MFSGCQPRVSLPTLPQQVIAFIARTAESVDACYEELEAYYWTLFETRAALFSTDESLYYHCAYLMKVDKASNVEALRASSSRPVSFVRQL